MRVRIFHCVYVPDFLIHSSVKGYLGYFHFLAIINKAAMKRVEQVSILDGETCSGYLRMSYIGES